MNKKTTFILVGCLLAVAGTYLVYRSLYTPPSANETANAVHTEEAAAVKYTCPMHPQIISDKPGQCPICGMDLVAIDHGHNQNQQEKTLSNAAQDDSGRKVIYWYDPMRPEQRFDKPGKSPFMDMELVPKYADAADEADAGGKPTISISAENVQKMGVRTEKVSKGSVSQTIRATGIVMPNERIRWDMFSQIEGRVDDLKYSAEGDRVKKGDLFYTLISPELQMLQNDYIAAQKAGLNDLAEAAGRRLKLLGVDGKVIATLAKTGKSYTKVPFFIPADGILAKLEIRNGHYLKTNDEIGHIQDLSTVWVEAAVAEGDLPAIKQGDHATAMFTGIATPYEAKVDYIYPTITPETRTGKVRLVIDNTDDNLRPAGYATVNFAAASAEEKLAVPSEAVLRSSTDDHVILALGDGKFQARSVKTGAASGGRTEILEGLQEGEDVVTSAQFLIDSESSLRESLQKLSGEK